MMINLTEKLKKIEKDDFACGGSATLHIALLNSDDDSSKSQIVAVKFPDLRKTLIGEEADRDEARAKILQRWSREIAAGQSVSHPNILPFLGFCNNPDLRFKEFDGLVLPFCENGDAKAYLQKHPEADRLRILTIIAATIDVLHSSSPPVVHGDIKASNILIDYNGQPLIADFGLSRICDRKGFTTQSIMGTYRWMAVELLQASVDNQAVRTTVSSDIWALAMTILEVLTGQPPFDEFNYDGGVFYYVLVKKTWPRRPDGTHVNDTLWALLERCWDEDPVTWSSARHVLGILCKWLHCFQAFKCIDDCVTHEYTEFTERCAVACP